MKRILLFFLLSVLINFQDTCADTLYLKNGTKVEGKLITQDEEKIVFRIAVEEDGVDVTFYSKEILKIDKPNVSDFTEGLSIGGKEVKLPTPVLKTTPLLTRPQEQIPDEQFDDKKDERQRIISEVLYGGGIEKGKTAGDLSKGPIEGLITKEKKDLLLKTENIINELFGLLNEEEKDYFTYINSEVKKNADEALALLVNPQLFSQDSTKLLDSITHISKKLDDIIKVVADLKPPFIFVDFHKKYLNSLNVIKETFQDMSKGSMLDAQTKMVALQSIEKELTQELEKILEEKKGQ